MGACEREGVFDPEGQARWDAATRPAHTALFLSAFFDELRRCGLRDVVVSPGSRSTPLSMVANAAPLNLYVDVDERGAAFFALGLAKASGRPVAVIATSGTAVANYLPAVMEAQSSRVPLVVLTGDRPLRLQGLGAPQTCDQVKVFGDAVRQFRQMPEPRADAASIAFARQAAREAMAAAAGVAEGSLGSGGGSLLDAAPVHLNFPFDDPLKPDLAQAGLFTIGRVAIGGRVASTERELQPRIGGWLALGPNRARDIARWLLGKRVVAVCGERCFTGSGGMRNLLRFAREFQLPLLADPLSQLRGCDDPLVIDNYDSFLAHDAAPTADVVIRFGRWPVSKRLTQWFERTRPAQLVVDPRESRDFTSATDVFVRTTPGGFVSALLEAREKPAAATAVTCVGAALPACIGAADWARANEAAAARIRAVGSADDDWDEGVLVRELLAGIPDGTLLFAGNSMAVRALDTFMLKEDRRLPVLCNRGLNGIDGTLSTAFGAAQHFDQTVVLVGDITALHDLNALALQGEMLLREREGCRRPSIAVICMDNGGGAIFDMLPQASDEPYFERLFLTPQQVDFGPVCAGFKVPYEQAESREELRAALDASLGVPGISFIDARLPLRGVKGRYGRYW